MITVKDQYAGILPRFRPFIRLNSLPLADELMPSLACFWTAVNTLFPLLRMGEPVQVFLGTNEPGRFETDFGKKESDGQTLDVQLGDNVFGLSLNGIIFFDVARIASYAPEVQVALYQHELIHSIMRVEDEKLNNKIVLVLNPGVAVVNDRFFFPLPDVHHAHGVVQEISGDLQQLEGGNGERDLANSSA